MSYKRILVPVDSSATSQEGLKEAIGLAKTQRARLRVVHVIDVAPILNLPDGGIDFAALEAEVKRAGQDIIDRAVAAAARRGMRAEAAMPDTRGTTVAEVIVAEARRWRADLIVLGTHGRSGLKRLVMGSSAEMVLRIARAPVLLVPGPAHRPPKRATRAHRSTDRAARR